jgi:ribosomal protein S18 acetylase RimI-like enzyme
VAGSLRSFRYGDRDAVVELSRFALARPEMQVGNPAWSTRDELESELADWDPGPEETLCVAEERRRLVGFGGVELPEGFAHAELFGPIVAPSAQGHGLGTDLLEASIERARRAPVTSLAGSVGTRNTSSRVLLERHGFRPRARPTATYRLTRAQHRPVRAAPSGVTVRVAGEEDLDDALALYRECFPEGRFPAAVWRQTLASGTVYTAEDDGRVVAVLNIDPHDRWIYHVGVTESERKRGVGSYLLSAALEHYWDRHPGETLGLDVAADNIPAIRLYRRQGFAPWLVLQTLELEL